MSGAHLAIRVVEAGWATTIQDHGRAGWGHLGVSSAGAVDRRSHDLVNRLVGNVGDAATIETLGGLVIEAVAPLIVASSNDGTRHTLQAGDRLSISAPAGQVWAYLAVRGGIAVEPVLGSRSRDTLSGLGPAPVSADDLLPVGADPLTSMHAELAPATMRRSTVRVWPGPHCDWFTGSISALTDGRWTVTDEISRVGARLAVGRFDTTVDVVGMRSIGLVPGAIQVTPAGIPIVMLADQPTTGGYPVIAVVDPDDLALVAQSRPGTMLRFEDARARRRARLDQPD